MALTQQAVQEIQTSRGGSYGNTRDANTHRIWDTRLIPTAVADYTFFSQPVGAPWRVAGTAKTLTETNLYDVGKLPNGQVMLVHRMGIACWVPMTTADVLCERSARAFNNLLSSSVFEIKLQGREWDAQVHGRFFEPMPIFNVGVGSANNMRVGDMIASGYIKLDPTPIVLDQMVTFSVIHRLNNPDPNVLTILNADCTLLNSLYGVIMVVLEGFLTRAK